MIILTPSKNLKSYQVYSLHSLPERELLYLGFARIPEIFTFRQFLKNPDFKADQPHEIILHSSFNKSWEAQNEASRLYRLLVPQGQPAPLYNRAMQTRLLRSVQCDQTGVTYPNASAACMALNIPQPRMSNHLQGRAGHKSIYGLTFRYV